MTPHLAHCFLCAQDILRETFEFPHKTRWYQHLKAFRRLDLIHLIIELDAGQSLTSFRGTVSGKTYFVIARPNLILSIKDPLQLPSLEERRFHVFLSF